jgi:hypothetical protein
MWVTCQLPSGGVGTGHGRQLVPDTIADVDKAEDSRYVPAGSGSMWWTEEGKPMTSVGNEEQGKDYVARGPWSMVKGVTSARDEGQGKSRHSRPGSDAEAWPLGELAPKGPFCFCPGRVTAGGPPGWDLRQAP